MAVYAKERPDVVVLDLGLPGQDGFAVIQDIRKHALTPIVVLSARGDVEGKVKALGAGRGRLCDQTLRHDRASGPSARRLAPRAASGGEAPVFRSGPSDSRSGRTPRVASRDNEVHLSPKEYSLLRFLVGQVGRVVTHHQILEEVWGPANVEDVQYLRVLMRALRKKIEPESETQVPQLIITEFGVGYRLMLFPPEGQTAA